MCVGAQRKNSSPEKKKKTVGPRMPFGTHQGPLGQSLPPAIYITVGWKREKKKKKN